MGPLVRSLISQSEVLKHLKKPSRAFWRVSKHGSLRLLWAWLLPLCSCVSSTVTWCLLSDVHQDTRGLTHSHVQHRVMLPFSWATADILTHAVSKMGSRGTKALLYSLISGETPVSEPHVTFFPGQRRASMGSQQTPVCMGWVHWICCVTPLSSMSHSSPVVHLGVGP